MSPTSIEKTAFCPGPGYGLWEFTVMPYGLTGATQTCQRGLYQVLKDCKDCVDNYIDDCIVFSDDMQSHMRDLQRVLSRLRNAGFTLHGSKCFFEKTSLSHLGFQYSPEGITPTADKTQSIFNWPIPASKKKLRSFLGLVNFYRRFIPRFASIAAPLTSLTANKVPFKWNPEHQTAFKQLRQALVSPPILDYPQPNDHFILTTDASDVGLGAILSTARGTTKEYASRTLTTPETKFSTIEKECLAIVWAIRKFRHYLLGACFTLRTDHKPLEWLDSAKKSRSHSQRLERWSLELQAYEFNTTYQPGIKNQVADALSRHPVNLVSVDLQVNKKELSQAQSTDPVLKPVNDHLSTSDAPPPPSGIWRTFPHKRFKQLWSQLCVLDGLLCRKRQTATTDSKYLIVVPQSLHKHFLSIAHEASGHQGSDRTFSILSDSVYWVGMTRDVNHHCSHCFKCQVTKAPASKPAPLQPVITTRPWEMVAVDVLKVPASGIGKQYILVVQDYFSKLPFAFAMADQKANRIVQLLKDNVFALVGPPTKLHSDQGRNFESRILSDLCAAFGAKKSHTTPYHPMGDGPMERMNRSLLNLLRAYTDNRHDWEEHLQLLLFFYRTTRHSVTGLSPYEVLFGSNPPSLHLPNIQTSVIPDPSSYSICLQKKLLELRELVEANIIEASDRQCQTYSNCAQKALSVGQHVLLTNPTCGKLDPRWTGPWTITELVGQTTVTVQMGKALRTVHLNRLRPLLEPPKTPLSGSSVPSADWCPPLFVHEEGSESLSIPFSASQATPPPSVTTRSGRLVKPVSRYGDPITY